MPRNPTSSSSLALVVAWLLFLWLVFLAQKILAAVLGIDLVAYAGLQPRTLHGLWGILGAHLLHANLAHIASNTLGLLILGLLGCWYSKRLTAWAVAYSAVGAGAFTWLVAPAGAVHIGASGVVFGLIGFLVANGIVRRSWGALLIAIPVGMLFWLVLPGLLPSEANRAQLISWQMHLGGFLGGALASWELRKLPG
jgi:membrane associated rhomboid family serine protease